MDDYFDDYTSDFFDTDPYDYYEDDRHDSDDYYDASYDSYYADRYDDEPDEEYEQFKRYIEDDELSYDEDKIDENTTNDRSVFETIKETTVTTVSAPPIDRLPKKKFVVKHEDDFEKFLTNEG